MKYLRVYAFFSRTIRVIPPTHPYDGQRVRETGTYTGMQEAVTACKDVVDSLVFVAPPMVYRSVEDTSVDDVQMLTKACLHDLHNAVRTVIPLMKQRRSGTIVAVTSDYAVSAVPDVAAYAAATAAMNAYVRAVAVECCKYGIRGNCVMTGFNTAENADRFREYCPEVDAESAFDHYQVLQREVTAADVANAVLFCASSMSNSILGECFPVDGGALAIGHSQVWPPRDRPVFTLSLKEKKS